MRKLLLLFFTTLCLQLQAQFPSEWIGNYSGEMILSSEGNKIDSVTVTLEIREILKDSSWTYNMTYLSSRFGKIEKKYTIIQEYGKYLLDEENGIRIEMAYMNDTFYEFYEVENTLFASTMRKIGDSILFEIFGAPKTPSKTTSTLPEEDGTSHVVQSMKPNFAQTVLLKKSNQ